MKLEKIAFLVTLFDCNRIIEAKVEKTPDSSERELNKIEQLQKDARAMFVSWRDTISRSEFEDISPIHITLMNVESKRIDDTTDVIEKYYEKKPKLNDVYNKFMRDYCETYFGDLQEVITSLKKFKESNIDAEFLAIPRISKFDF
jgi:hypothetical protein